MPGMGSGVNAVCKLLKLFMNDVVLEQICMFLNGSGCETLESKKTVFRHVLRACSSQTSISQKQDKFVFTEIFILEKYIKSVSYLITSACNRAS